MGAQSLLIKHVHVPITISPPPPPPLINTFTTKNNHIYLSNSKLLAKTNPFDHQGKGKVVFVMGATGTGKSRLSIDLANHFDGEVVNSDKMQVYKGLNITTNKVTDEECGGIPHHLLGTIEPDEDFDASDFRRCTMEVVDQILARGRLPIIAGGSNSYIEALVDGDNKNFRSKYECCFLWVDVSLPVLYSFVSERVDQMVNMGMVNEAKQMFDPLDVDYSKGIRRAIGFPEMDRFLRGESTEVEAIAEIKDNTCILARKQLKKIKRLRGMSGWQMNRLDATKIFLKRADKTQTNQAWEKLIATPSIRFVDKFLSSKIEDNDNNNDNDNNVKVDHFTIRNGTKKTIGMTCFVNVESGIAVVGAT